MLPSSIQNLIAALSKLPDIGPRAATRLIFYLINQEQKDLDELALYIKELKTKIKLCKNCFNISDAEKELCSICQDKNRHQETVCVVENILNILPIEKTRQYNGLYHVLGGLISPLNNLGPDNLKINELIGRIKNNQPLIKEIIIALNPTTEGDATTLYLERLLKPLKIKITRLGRGLSFGSDLEYIDENTLINALRGRK